MKIAILTTLSDFHLGYSICGVVLDQARLLARHGHDVTLLVNRFFNPSHIPRAPFGVRLQAILPSTDLHDYRPDEPERPEFRASVDQYKFGNGLADGDQKRTVGYAEATAGYDAVITHDLMFSTWFLPCNAALREIERPAGQRWLHFAHSAPSDPLPQLEGIVYPSTLRFTADPHPNATHVYLNHRDSARYAHSLGRVEHDGPRLQADDVGVVYNSRDIFRLHGFSRHAEALARDCDLLGRDIVLVYPFSTPRWRAKGVDRLLALVAEWKRGGRNPFLVLVNAHANQKKDERYIAQMLREADAQGVEEAVDFALTSRWAETAAARGSDEDRLELTPDNGSGWLHSVPYDDVVALQKLATMFVFPTESENCSLVLAEAMLTGSKLCVVNSEVPSLWEFVPKSTLGYRFKSEIPIRNPAYYRDVAREILNRYDRDWAIAASLHARKLYDPDRIYETQLGPLLAPEKSPDPDARREPKLIVFPAGARK